MIKGLIAGILGLKVSTVGFDHLTGSGRFIFYNPYLLCGISLVRVLIGMYASGQVLVSASDESVLCLVMSFKKEKFSPCL